MPFIEGSSRHQTSLFPESLEEAVAADHPVRVVDAFVDGLDLSALGFGRAIPEETGRPPYHPGDLLKLYLYGYLNQIRSSRRLERECRRNVEVMWLLRRLAPDFKTIADFRRYNAEGLRGVCRAFVAFCREQCLVSGELVAIDGSKFQAVASLKRAQTKGQACRELDRLDHRIAGYLEELDAGDRAEEEGEAGPAEVAAALETLRERRAELQALAKQMQEQGTRQVVVGEPEAKLMQGSRGQAMVGYNVQTAVDAKHKLIVHHEVVTDCNDSQQLIPMARGAKAAVGVETLIVVTDGGYRNGEQSAQCEAEGILPVVPTQQMVNPHGEYFSRDAFIYDPARDCYRCPAGEVLRYRKKHRLKKARIYSTSACPSCALRPRCTPGRMRKLYRPFHLEAMEAADRRARDAPQLLRLRAELAEHPFGTLKRMMAGGKFLTRGLRIVRAEMALSITVYNLLRTVNILGVPRLLSALTR